MPSHPDRVRRNYVERERDPYADPWVARDELLKIRQLCLDAGMSEPSTAYNYLQGVFYHLKILQADYQQLFGFGR